MSDRLRSMLTRLAAYVGVMVAAGLLLLAALSVYQMMWPKPVVPLGRWVIEKSGTICDAAPAQSSKRSWKKRSSTSSSLSTRAA